MIQDKKEMVDVSKPKFGSPSKPATTPTDPKTNLFASPDESFLKMVFGMFTIAVVAGLQLYAWYSGHNGAIFAFTSAVIGLVAGSVLGFTWGLKKDGSN